MIHLARYSLLFRGGLLALLSAIIIFVTEAEMSTWLILCFALPVTSSETKQVQKKSLLAGWQIFKLGDICLDISYGYTASASNEKIGPKFLRITDIVPERINWATVPYCKIEDKDIKKYLLNKGDIVIARTGATTGYNKIIKDDVQSIFASYLIRYKVDSKIAYPSYVGHVLQSSNWKKFVYGVKGGSAQPGANAKQLGSFEIILPTLPEQEVIAEILSGLDNKIDLLRRQNKTLVSMAQTLFRKWFIDNSSHANWDKVSLGNSKLSQIISSGIKKFEREKTYHATADIQGENTVNDGAMISYNKRPARANMQPVEFSVWFAKKGGVRKVLMFDGYSKNIDNIILSTGFSGLKTNALSHYYIWCFISSMNFQNIKDGSLSGTVQPDINNDAIKDIEISCPDDDILKRFNDTVKPLFIKIQHNTKEIRTLAKMYDLLLPKLMSGKARVNGFAGK